MGWFTKTLTDHNNDGQRDASEGEKRSPPNTDPVSYVSGILSSDIKELNKSEQDAYNAGYDNASKKK